MNLNTAAKNKFQLIHKTKKKTGRLKRHKTGSEVKSRTTPANHLAVVVAAASWVSELEVHSQVLVWVGP